jgi:hypothetical protein
MNRHSAHQRICVVDPRVRIELAARVGRDQAPSIQDIGRAEVEAMIDHLGDVGAALTRARPERLAELYGSLDLQLMYHPDDRLVDVRIDPRRGSERVRGGTCVLTTWLAVGCAPRRPAAQRHQAARHSESRVPHRDTGDHHPADPASDSLPGPVVPRPGLRPRHCRHLRGAGYRGRAGPRQPDAPAPPRLRGLPRPRGHTAGRRGRAGTRGRRRQCRGVARRSPARLRRPARPPAT